MTRTVSPKQDPDFMKDVIAGRKKKVFSDVLYRRLHSAFSGIEYAPGEMEDFHDHLLDTDKALSLEDATPLFAFFGLQANKARRKEKYYEEMLKTLERSSVKNSVEKVSIQKGGARTTDTYKKTQQVYLDYKKIREDCEVLKDAMSKRLEMARTKSVDERVESTGSYLTNQ